MGSNVSMEYILKVTRYLQSLEPGTVVDLSKSPTREDFIEVAKQYIDTWGELEFNENYQKLRKCRN